MIHSIQKYFILLNQYTKSKILVLTVFIVFTLSSFGYYTYHTLEGKIDNHILAGDMFGVPKNLKERGIRPLYFGPGQTGWDGQFYYYMSNDLLARGDTPVHIDSPSYRYQRIGLSLYAACIAKILGQEWVSPKLYFCSYFILILVATFFGAKLFEKFGMHPILILLWSLNAGTQITLFNALPDASADAFLILALYCLYSTYVIRYFIAAILFSFSALSREVYVLFPSLIFLCCFIHTVFRDMNVARIDIKIVIKRAFYVHNFYWLIMPGILFLLWRAYIINHFGIAPSQQAFGVLGLPFVGWWKYFISGIQGNHLLVGKGIQSYSEAILLLCFLGVILCSLCVVARFIYKSFTDYKSDESLLCTTRGLAFTLLCLSFLYISFGPTVIMHYTGYFKAISIFFFLIPLLIPLSKMSTTKKIVYTVLLFSFCIVSVCNMRFKILANGGNGFNQYTHLNEITESKRIECFGEYNAQVSNVVITFNSPNILQKIIGIKNLIIIDLDLQNTGKYDFISTKNSGGVYMSYHWVDESGNVVLDGIRTAILNPLKPGKSTKLTVVSKIPTIPLHSKEVYLKLSPVQEGCAWFYVTKRADILELPILIFKKF